MSETIITETSLTTARISPLDAAHARLGAQMGVRDGVRIPLSYGDPSAEYESVRGSVSAGLIDLSSRGRIIVSGTEAVMFLNGLVTNDVKTLADDAWMWAAFPNVQGRLIALARVVRLSDEFHFDTEPATHAAVVKSLGRFTLAGDFRVRDATNETANICVQGARASRIVAEVFGEEAARIERFRAQRVQLEDRRAFLIRATHTSEDGFDVFCKAEDAVKIWEAFVSAGARPFGFDALEILRIEAGAPLYGADVDETNVVLEAVPDEAVSFTKGCYVGQEIIARIHWRGHVAKKLTGLVIESETATLAGASIRAVNTEREIGRITSCAYSPRLGHTVALGILKYDFLKPETEVQILLGENETTVGRVVALPHVRGSWYESDASAGAEA